MAEPLKSETLRTTKMSIFIIEPISSFNIILVLDVKLKIIFFSSKIYICFKIGVFLTKSLFFYVDFLEN